jgi:hypothetical protein
MEMRAAGGVAAVALGDGGGVGRAGGFCCAKVIAGMAKSARPNANSILK